MIHPPKQIYSDNGHTLESTHKSTEIISNDHIILTEVWRDMDEPWSESGTIIALPGYTWTSNWVVGQCYVQTKIEDTSGNYVGVYIDICRPVTRQGSRFAFTDMYLDIWQQAGQLAVLLDEDELAQALADGHITNNDADDVRIVAMDLLRKINSV